MKSGRDIEKAYSNREFVEKLRRLADAIETGKRFQIQIAGSVSMFLLVQYSISSMNAMEMVKRSNFRSNGQTDCVWPRAFR